MTRLKEKWNSFSDAMKNVIIVTTVAASAFGLGGAVNAFAEKLFSTPNRVDQLYTVLDVHTETAEVKMEDLESRLSTIEREQRDTNQILCFLVERIAPDAIVLQCVSRNGALR